MALAPPLQDAGPDKSPCTRAEAITAGDRTTRA